MRIKSVILKHFRNAAHFQLHAEFKRLAELFTPEALKSLTGSFWDGRGYTSG